MCENPANSVPQGRLKITRRPWSLGDFQSSLRDFSAELHIPRTVVLGYTQPSLRD